MSDSGLALVLLHLEQLHAHRSASVALGRIADCQHNVTPSLTMCRVVVIGEIGVVLPHKTALKDCLATRVNKRPVFPAGAFQTLRKYINCAESACKTKPGAAPVRTPGVGLISSDGGRGRGVDKHGGDGAVPGAVDGRGASARSKKRVVFCGTVMASPGWTPARTCRVFCWRACPVGRGRGGSRWVAGCPRGSTFLKRPPVPARAEEMSAEVCEGFTKWRF